jgi:hypothetical protein
VKHMAKLGESAIIGALIGFIIYIITQNIYFAACVAIIYTLAAMCNAGGILLVIIALGGGLAAAQYIGHSPLSFLLPFVPSGGEIPQMPTGLTLPNWSVATTGTTLVAQSSLSSSSSSASTTSSVSSSNSCPNQCCQDSDCALYENQFLFRCISGFCEQRSCQTTLDCGNALYSCQHQVCQHI